MSGIANLLDDAWAALAARETVDAATRIFGLWSATATPFSVFVLRPDAAILPCVVALEAPLQQEGIMHCIPPDFLHITVQSLGNLGESGLTEAIADALADTVAAALADTPPFALRLYGVNSFGAAAFVGVHEEDPSLPLQRMQRRVVDALVAADRVPVRHPERPYLPHLSLCYYDRAYPADTVVRALAPNRRADCGSVSIEAIELVRIAGNGAPYPPMETVRRIALGGGV